MSVARTSGQGGTSRLGRARSALAAGVLALRGYLGHRKRRQALTGLLLLSPWIVGFFVMNLYPVVESFYYSLTNYDILQPPQWAGLFNYTAMLHDPNFWQALYNTAYITVLGVPLSLGLGLGLALALNARVAGIAIYRAIVYVPTVVPAVAVAIIWLWILNPDYGLLNGLLTLVHLPTPGWLTDPIWAKPALIMMVLWSTAGQTMIVFLAGLQGVSVDQLEAAVIDGAGAWRRFLHVTLPALGPVAFYSAVTGVVFFLNFFTQAFVVTSGGGAGGSGVLGAPAQSTLFLGIYLYQAAFEVLHMGYAAALAWVIFAIIMVLTVLLFGLGRTLVYYEGADRS